MGIPREVWTLLEGLMEPDDTQPLPIPDGDDA